MTTALNLLQTINQESKPYKGFKHLSHGNHRIESFRFVKNKMHVPDSPKSLERVLMVELCDQVLFLPSYFAQKLENSDARLDELNNDGIVKYLYFGGTRPNKSWIIYIKTEDEVIEEEEESQLMISNEQLAQLMAAAAPRNQGNNNNNNNDSGMDTQSTTLGNSETQAV